MTDDDLVVMASEAGVLPIPESKIIQKWRLQPGKMFLIDLDAGRIIGDKELKQRIITEKPYRQWLRDNMLRIKDLPEAPHVHVPDHLTVLQRQIAFNNHPLFSLLEHLVYDAGKREA